VICVVFISYLCLKVTQKRAWRCKARKGEIKLFTTNGTGSFFHFYFAYLLCHYPYL